jgi:hypothetical protein
MSEEIKKQSLFDRALNAIERGRQGENDGIPIPFSRLAEYIPNIQRKTYYLIGGASKSGKTSLADDIFLYGAYDYYKYLKDTNQLDGIELDFDYFSFEIDTDTKIVKGISRKLWHDYGIIADSKTILSKGKFHCSDEIYTLVRNLRDYFNDLEDILTISDSVDNPTGINKYLINKAKKHGEIVSKNINKDPEGEPILRFSHYIPKNTKRYHLFFVDHLALTMEERGFSLKQTMDKVSSYAVGLRNNFSMSPVIVQQMSFETTNDDRFKSNRLSPTVRDFGDSRYPVRDCNIAMCLFNPYSLHLERFHNYNIVGLGDSYRNLEILVNRDGEPNINVGLNFIGPCGTFRELPKASEMTQGKEIYAATYANKNSTYVKNANGEWILNK